MPRLSLKAGQRQRVLMALMAVLVLVFFGYLFIDKFKEGMALRPAAPIPRKRIEINFGFLEDQRLKELEPLEKFSLPQEQGRENPFLPYKTD